MKSIENLKSLEQFHLPLYRVIEQDFRSRVRDGKWYEGRMIPSRQSLAKEYCVDVRTIQRAISNLLADGTLYAHGGRGTFVSMSTLTAREPSVSSKAVMIIAEQPCNPGAIWSAHVQAVHEGLRKHIYGCPILTFNTTDRTLDGVIRNEQDALRLAETDGYSGIIMFHRGGEATLPDIRRVMNANLPIVFVDRLPFGHGCNFVGVDNRSGARDAVEYLLSIGHRRIAFIAPQENVSTIDDRLHGYLDAFMGLGIQPPQDLIFRIAVEQSFSRHGLQSELCRIISETAQLAEPPTAIFAINDYVAENLILVLREMGIDVPKSLSIVGFDDVETFLTTKPKLTTVKQPFRAIGERAAAMLCWRMSLPAATSDAFQHVVLQTSLVIRESTQPIVGRKIKT